MKKGLFGTSGIRGSADELFTDQFSFDIGRAFGAFLRLNKLKGRVAIGMDPRESSPRIKKAVASGLIHEGFDVYDQGVVPIPSINYILKLDSVYAGSLMVSGSHIKPHLNGLKFFTFEEEILKHHEKSLEERYHAIKNKVKYQDLSNLMIDEDKAHRGYIKYLHSKVIKYPNWKVITDTGNGAQSEVFNEFIEELNLKLIKLNSSIQLNFLSRDTEVEGDFKNLQEKVLEENADFGIGFDSDGDRVVFIDEKGNFIPGDYSGTLISRSISDSKLVTPINTSQVVDYIGKEVFRTKVGSPYVVEKMKEIGAYFGFEANGGGIFKEMMSRDGGRSAVELMNILGKSRKKLSELVAELPKYFISRDKIEYEWKLQDKIVNSVKENFKGVRIEEIDGLKIWIDDNTWILFRSSQNAPEFRVFVESKNKEESEKLLQKGLQFVYGVINENKI